MFTLRYFNLIFFFNLANVITKLLGNYTKKAILNINSKDAKIFVLRSELFFETNEKLISNV